MYDETLEHFFLIYPLIYHVKDAIFYIMDLAKRILAGDVRTASKLMRDLDDRLPAARDVLKELYPKTGKAYIIGITGPPGSGKSTIVDKMTDVFRKEGKTIGIIAVDPTSPFSGGAILGDRIRMQSHATDEGVFIRSIATRGRLGGLSRSTQDIVNVMDAMGKEIILVETVGVGQDEVDIIDTAHTSIVILIPGMGDDIQTIKAGLIEIGELFVVNKCDLEGAEKTAHNLRALLEMGGKKEDGWKPFIVKTEAISGKGISELVKGVYCHKQAVEKSNVFEKKRKERMKKIFIGILESELIAHFAGKIEKELNWDGIIDNLVNRNIDPYTEAERVIFEVLGIRTLI